jgi:hypothetical protein
MRFIFEGYPIETSFGDETRSPSPYTGQDLTRGTIEVRARDKDPLFKRLQDGGILLAADGTRWPPTGESFKAPGYSSRV